MTNKPAIAAGSAIIAFCIAINVAYALLVAEFGYDDILREALPPSCKHSMMGATA